ncbi:hypothetical protein ACF0H5_019482 [Mactra antiquata]
MKDISTPVVRRSLSSPKEAPLLDFDIDVAGEHYLDNNLKLMYEKRGGVCTLINGYSSTPIYVISTCRLGFSLTRVWELCEHTPPFSSRLHKENVIDLTRTPVQDVEGFVYRNIYCAQCNNVYLVQAWTTRLDCDHLQPLSFSDGTDEITIMGDVADRAMGCARRLQPAVPRMIHQCSHIDVISQMRYHTTRIGDGSKGNISPFPLSFSILMNFGFDGKTHILFTTTANQQSVSITCDADERFDPQYQKCRPIYCNSGYKWIEGTCKRISNYDTDSNQDDLTNLSDIDEPLQVILTLKNITYGDMYLLNITGVEELLKYNLANEFNISNTRIQNLTVHFLDNSGLNSSRNGESIEIRRFTTIKPDRQTSEIEVVTAKPNGKFAADSVDPSYRPVKGNHNSYNKQYLNSKNGGGTKNASIDIEVIKYGKVDQDHSNPLANTTSHEKESALKQMSENTEHHDGDISVWANITDNPGNAWVDYPDMSARIIFVLLPQHSNRTAMEKSVNRVVQTMSDLMNSNQFMLTINGTSLQVQRVENTPQSVSAMDEFCKGGLKPLLDESEFELIQSFDNETLAEVTVIRVNSTGALFHPGEYDLTFNIDGNVGNLNQTQVTSWAFVCKMPALLDKQCGRIVLTKDEYFTFDNNSIKFANRTYNMSEYEYENVDKGTVWICAPHDWIAMQQIYDAGKWTLACGEELVKLVIAESYLTFILGVISLFCMLSVLITYGLFEKLRNLPGVNTMNLTFSLFMGELLFIMSGWIQPHHAWLCSAVGVLLHYLFLASFFWMNVMSYDVFKTFAKKCILTRVRNKAKYFPRYSLYAWGCPLIIVTVCSVLDFTSLIIGVKIGYGGNSVANVPPAHSTNASLLPTEEKGHVYSIGCWIQQPVASMAAFGGPMILILFVNCVMFTRTIICIRRSTRSARMSVRKQSSFNHMTGRDDVMLYFRMSTVMGFTWIFGLASSFVSAFAEPSSKAVCIVLHLLGILFIVFNCSQGVFIFFAFVCNRRVLALYKAFLERLKSGKPRPPSISSSRTTLTTNTSQTSLSHIT